MLKINFDGAVFSESNCSSAGVVIHNHQGLVIASLSQKFSTAFAPLEVKALAATQALEFAVELGIKHAILKGDSLMLILALKNGCVDLSPYGLLLDDVWYRSNFFTQLHYSHVKRKGNKVAHYLAQYVVNAPSFLVWIEDVLPQFVFIL